MRDGGSLAEPHFEGERRPEAMKCLGKAFEDLRGWQRDLCALTGTCRSLWASRSELKGTGRAELTLVNARLATLWRLQEEDWLRELWASAAARMKEAARELPDRDAFLELARSIADEMELY